MINDYTGQSDTQDAVASLQQSFQDSLTKQAAVWEKLTEITKDESVRFAKNRLEKTTKTLEAFGNSGADAKSLMAGQQQWLQDMVKDYADQSMRYSQMFREIATSAFSNAVASTRKAAQTSKDLAEEGAAEMEKTVNVVRRSGEDMADQGRENISRGVDAMNAVAENEPKYNNPGSDYNSN